ncbi:MAG: hypothetical protein JO112_18680, partial [Planctomycetes bacterium]|nr:hypothetical protein [Planctomycetota bacterium]
RHTENPLGPRVHFLFAFVVVAGLVWLVKLAFETRPRDRQLTATVLLLAGLVCLQLFLGMETWLAKFAEVSGTWPQLRPLTLHPELIRSVHYLVGSGIFATAVAVALEAHRRTAWAVHLTPTPVSRLEGAA